MPHRALWRYFEAHVQSRPIKNEAQFIQQKSRNTKQIEWLFLFRTDEQKKSAMKNKSIAHRNDSAEYNRQFTRHFGVHFEFRRLRIYSAHKCRWLFAFHSINLTTNTFVRAVHNKISTSTSTIGAQNEKKRRWKKKWHTKNRLRRCVSRCLFGIFGGFQYNVLFLAWIAS